MADTVLVTGGAGRLARALARRAADMATACPHNELDITDADSIARALGRHRPGCVINTAVVGVDLSEREPDLADRVNVVAPALLAAACARAEIPLLHISTDYVFGAETQRPWRETDPVSPINAYGRSKSEGEARVLEAGGHVVRVAWLFGDADDFLARILCSGRQELDVAADQLGSPTPIDEAAAHLLEFARAAMASAPDLPPLLHLAGTPAVSRADWVAVAADALAAQGGLPPRISPRPVGEIRPGLLLPRTSALDSGLAAARFGWRLDWRAASVARVRAPDFRGFLSESR